MTAAPRQTHLSCLLVGLEHGSEGGDLLPLGGQQRLEFDDLFLQLLDLRLTQPTWDRTQVYGETGFDDAFFLYL